MKQSADALLHIINQILDFSKIEAGKLDLEMMNFNVRDLVDRTVQSLALRAHRKDLELSCHILPEVPATITGDPVRLQQVIANLVTNAIKFTDSGGVNRPVPVIETDGRSTNGIRPTLTPGRSAQPTQVRTSERSVSMPSPFAALTHTMSP